MGRVCLLCHAVTKKHDNIDIYPIVFDRGIADE